MKMVECKRCEGAGKTVLFTSVEDPCIECKGSGKVPAKESVNPEDAGNGRFIYSHILKNYLPEKYPLYWVRTLYTDIRRNSDGFRLAFQTIENYETEGGKPEVKKAVISRTLFNEIGVKAARFSVNTITGGWGLWSAEIHTNPNLPNKHCFLISNPVILEGTSEKCYLVYGIKND